VVGVNEYTMEPYKIHLLEMDPEGERKQFARLKRLREERDDAKMRKRLDALRKAAEGERNTMPHIMEAVQAYATLGETAECSGRSSASTATRRCTEVIGMARARAKGRGKASVRVRSHLTTARRRVKSSRARVRPGPSGPG